MQLLQHQPAAELSLDRQEIVQYPCDALSGPEPTDSVDSGPEPVLYID